jgi:hypothetical protein
MENVVILNGNNVNTQAKQVQLNVNNVALNLTLVYLSQVEMENSVKFEFEIVKNVKVQCVKASKKIACTVVFNNKVVFTNLSVQSVFAVIQAKFKQSVATSNNLYVKANTTRKQYNASASKLVITENGIF